MPIYTFEKDGQILEIQCSSSEIEQKHLELEKDGYSRIWKMNIVHQAGSSAVTRTDDTWKDILKSVKKNNPRSNIDV